MAAAPKLDAPRPADLGGCGNPEELERRADHAIRRHMRARLRAGDLFCLREASGLRQTGLDRAHARSGDAAGPLAQARAIIEGPAIAPEAHLLGLSYQEPAEAYLAYRAHDAALAATKLRQTLSHIAELVTNHGYAMESRRAHIARNLLVTQRRAGLYAESGRMAAQLAIWALGRGAWPLEIGSAAPQSETLEDDIREGMADQLIAELIRIAIASPQSVDMSSLLALDPRGDPLMQRVQTSLHLVLASLSANHAQRQAILPCLHEMRCGRLFKVWEVLCELPDVGVGALPKSA